MTLADKYRPRTWADVIGQDAIVKRLKSMQARGGFAGHALWFSGKSGAGKSSLALIAAATVADDFHTEVCTGRALTPSVFREWRSLSRFAAPRAFIVNEAHGLNRAVIEELLDELEPVPSHCAWFFTTTKEGQESLFDDQIDAHPLLSRCKVFALNERPGADAQAAKLLEIARAEGLDGRPLAQYVRMVNNNSGNWRASLNAIESGEMLP